MLECCTPLSLCNRLDSNACFLHIPPPVHSLHKIPHTMFHMVQAPGLVPVQQQQQQTQTLCCVRPSPFTWQVQPANAYMQAMPQMQQVQQFPQMPQMQLTMARYVVAAPYGVVHADPPPSPAVPACGGLTATAVAATAGAAGAPLKRRRRRRRRGHGKKSQKEHVSELEDAEDDEDDGAEDSLDAADMALSASNLSSGAALSASSASGLSLVHSDPVDSSSGASQDTHCTSAETVAAMCMLDLPDFEGLTIDDVLQDI